MRQSKALASSHSRRFRLYSSSMSTSVHFPSHCGRVANHPPTQWLHKDIYFALESSKHIPLGLSRGRCLENAPPQPPPAPRSHSIRTETLLWPEPPRLDWGWAGGRVGDGGGVSQSARICGATLFPHSVPLHWRKQNSGGELCKEQMTQAGYPELLGS